jgi:ATP-dependent Lon protease
VFPLPNAVLLPGALLPLHIFEPRYRTMVRHCLDTHRAMAIALILDGPSDAHDNPPIAQVAGVGVIIEHEELSDGRFNLLLRGEGRVRLSEAPFESPFRRARAELLLDRDEVVATSDATALAALASTFSAEVRAQNPTFEFQIPQGLAPNRVADYVAHYLVVDAAERQAILENLSPRERLDRTLEAVATQRARVRRPNSIRPS